MSVQKDYYRILGVPQDADLETLKKAYRRLAKKFHPDHRPDDVLAGERFRELKEAYEVLRDPAKRLRYDAAFSGLNGFHHGASEGTRHGSSSGDRGSRMSDVVSDMFEHLRRRMESRGRRGGDLRYHMTLTLEEAARGVSKVLQITRTKDCPVCDGRGWTTPGDSPACRVCRGEGEIQLSVGSRKTVRPCPNCGGRGILEKTPCERCKGRGRIPYRLKRNIRVPPGVDNGSRLKVRGDGEPGEGGGEHGDLYIVIQVQDHPFFTRKNLDLWCEVPIRFSQAVLGATIRVPTLNGERDLVIPAGTASGTVFRLEGCGLPGLNGSGLGDQHVRVVVDVPKKVSKKEREILIAWEKIQQSGGKGPPSP